MAEGNQYDLIVVGGGPADTPLRFGRGSWGARWFALNGACWRPCLNWGCIPSKALLKSAEAYQAALHSETFGFTCGETEVDFRR